MLFWPEYICIYELKIQITSLTYLIFTKYKKYIKKADIWCFDSQKFPKNFEVMMQMGLWISDSY